MLKEPQTIKVTVEKSHLLTLGERMYVESIELIRELVNNAYDADATEVYVTVTPASIIIEDDGSGMNERGLAQFFTMGSEEKKIHAISPRFGRKRIGQFGIGKFAALAAADRFVVESRKGNWIYSVIFDREEWQSNKNWELPITKEPATPLHHEGTKVALSKLKKQFNQSDVERYLKESVPLRAKRFVVYLNSKRIAARSIPGRHFPISIKTIYGTIDGGIVVALRPDLVEKPGLECRVRQVLIKREFFDLDKTHVLGLSRITGEVNADFLPIVSNRCDFIRDSAEFKLFYQVMRFQLEKVLKDLKKESEIKNLKKIKEGLKEVLSKVRTALALHPELLPSGRAVALRRQRRGGIAAGTIQKFADKKEIADESKTSSGQKEEKQEEKKIFPKPEVIKRIRLKRLGVSVALVSLGEESGEVLSEGNLIYINCDHPLYQKFYNQKEKFELHLLRLIIQEIVLMKKLRIGAREAFEWQSKLWTDAFCVKNHNKKEST